MQSPLNVYSGSGSTGSNHFCTTPKTKRQNPTTVKKLGSYRVVDWWNILLGGDPPQPLQFVNGLISNYSKKNHSPEHLHLFTVTHPLVLALPPLLPLPLPLHKKKNKF